MLEMRPFTRNKNTPYTRERSKICGDHETRARYFTRTTALVWCGNEASNTTPLSLPLFSRPNRPGTAALQATVFRGFVLCGGADVTSGHPPEGLDEKRWRETLVKNRLVCERVKDLQTHVPRP